MNKLLSEKDCAKVLQTTRQRLARYRLAGKMVPVFVTGDGNNARYYYDGEVALKMWKSLVDK